MKDGKLPNPNMVHPITGYENEIYIKPTIKNPNIIVGDFSYIADSDFASHVTHLYDWNEDKLIIGKFCQIASGVEFVMNGANHTFSTRMCEAGINVKVIQDTLGHQDISTTMNIYTDATKEMKKQEFESLDSYLKKSV